MQSDMDQALQVGARGRCRSWKDNRKKVHLTRCTLHSEREWIKIGLCVWIYCYLEKKT